MFVFGKFLIPLKDLDSTFEITLKTHIKWHLLNHQLTASPQKKFEEGELKNGFAMLVQGVLLIAIGLSIFLHPKAKPYEFQHRGDMHGAREGKGEDFRRLLRQQQQHEEDLKMVKMAPFCRRFIKMYIYDS